MRNTLVDFAAEIQRAQIERDLRRLRIGRLMEGMKFCPACFPELFDAGLEYTPNPVFCRAHASHVLARVFAEVRRDAAGVSRLVAPAPICQPNASRPRAGVRESRLAIFLAVSHPEWRLRA